MQQNSGTDNNQQQQKKVKAGKENDKPLNQATGATAVKKEPTSYCEAEQPSGAAAAGEVLLLQVSSFAPAFLPTASSLVSSRLAVACGRPSSSGTSAGAGTDRRARPAVSLRRPVSPSSSSASFSPPYDAPLALLLSRRVVGDHGF